MISSPLAPCRRPGSPRSVFALLGTFAALLASTGAASAQTPPQPPAAWECYISSGRFLPMGAQRGTLKGADLTALVVSYVPRPSLGITGTFGWARSHALATPIGQPRLDVFSFDLGAEARAPQRALGGAWKLAPFVGIGGGTRSYNIPRLPGDPTQNLAAYASLGGEFAIHRVHLRLEARDYVSSFKPLLGGGKASTRNDVAIMLGLRFAKKGA